MNVCRICNGGCDGTKSIDRFLYEGKPFTVCSDCLELYEKHDIKSISRKIEKNLCYDPELHTVKK